jgi:CHAD domain-containing protein
MPSAAMDETVQHLVQALSAIRAGDAPALRRARVASRRLREMLAVAEDMGGGASARPARRRIRRVTRALGPTRELDVALAELDRAALRHGWSEERLAPLRRWIVKEGKRRSGTLETFMEALDDKKLTRALTRTSRRLSGEDVPRRWQSAIVARAIRRWRAVKTAAEACGTLYAPERLHQLRIAVKKLRYALELAGRTARLDLAASIRSLKRSQRRYGQLHDRQVLLHLATTAAAVGRRTPVRVSAEIVCDALERDCRALHGAALADTVTLLELLPSIRTTLAAGVSAAPRAARSRKADSARPETSSRRAVLLAG